MACKKGIFLKRDSREHLCVEETELELRKMRGWDPEPSEGRGRSSGGAGMCHPLKWMRGTSAGARR